MPSRADLAGAIAFFLACAAVLLLQPISPDAGVTRDPDLVAGLLLVFTTLPLALRRRYPITVAAVVVPLSIFASLRGYALNLTAVGALFALASAAYFTDRPRTVAIGLFSVIGLTIGLVLSGGPVLSLQNLVSNLVTPVLAVVVGDVLRGRREYAQRWRDHAAEVERLRDADQARAVAQERVRVARDVHDVVGHRLAAITVQARAARRRAEADPACAVTALADIDGLATEALADTRRAVGAIGEERGAAPTHPVPAR